jgi:16S rRNA (cytidine1402-2'-O)-methyltransferase
VTVGRAAGCLLLVSTPIGNLGDLSARAAAALSDAELVACEDTRRTGRLLELAGLRARRLLSLHAHNEAARIGEVIAACTGGGTVALVSDAGTPLVSDPGERLVAAAIEAGIDVRAVPGPSAALAALVVSGLPVARWRFEGFLPRTGRERRARIAGIASSSETTVCFESPHRVAATLAELAGACGPARRVAVARELTKLHEETWRGSLGEAAERWARQPARGEHVLVVGASPPEAGHDGAALEDALRRLREAGLSARDAQRAAQVLLGASRRDAYDASVRAAAGPAPG